MANAELGAAILPRSIIPTQTEAHVQALRIVSPTLKRKIGLITLRDKALRPAATRLTELIRTHFQQITSSDRRR